MKTFLTVIAVICYIFGGFMLYIFELMTFFDFNAIEEDGPAEPAVVGMVLGVFFVLSAVPIGLGLACRQFERWARDLGVVLVSAGGFTLFVGAVLIVMKDSPEFQKEIDDPQMAEFMLGHWHVGMTVTAITTVAGVAMLISDARHQKAERARLDAREEAEWEALNAELNAPAYPPQGPAPSAPSASTGPAVPPPLPSDRRASQEDDYGHREVRRDDRGREQW